MRALCSEREPAAHTKSSRLTAATGEGATTTGLGEGEGDGEGEGGGEGEGDGLGEGDGEGDGLGDGNGLGDGDGEGEGLGCGGSSGTGEGSAGAGDGGGLPLPAGTSTAVASAVVGSLPVAAAAAVGSVLLWAAAEAARRSRRAASRRWRAADDGAATGGGGRRRPMRLAGGLSAIAGRLSGACAPGAGVRRRAAHAELGVRGEVANAVAGARAGAQEPLEDSQMLGKQAGGREGRSECGACGRRATASLRRCLRIPAASLLHHKHPLAHHALFCWRGMDRCARRLQPNAPMEFSLPASARRRVAAANNSRRLRPRRRAPQLQVAPGNAYSACTFRLGSAGCASRQWGAARSGRGRSSRALSEFAVQAGHGVCCHTSAATKASSPARAHVTGMPPSTARAPRSAGAASQP